MRVEYDKIMYVVCDTKVYNVLSNDYQLTHSEGLTNCSHVVLGSLLLAASHYINLETTQELESTFVHTKSARAWHPQGVS